MKKDIKITSKKIPLVNNLDLCGINKKDENNRSFDFRPFYTKFSEVYPDKERPDSLFLE
jgi:hypothetical protein